MSDEGIRAIVLRMIKGSCYCSDDVNPRHGAIQVLRKDMRVRGGGGSNFQEKSIKKVYSSTLLVLRGSGWLSIFEKKALRNI